MSPRAPRDPASTVLGSGWFWAALVAVAFLVPLARSLWLAQHDPLPVIARVPDWRLTNQDGRAFGSQELRGRAYIADFIFTTCAASCPRLTARMASLQPRLRNMAGGVHLVSISVDPVNDTPARLREYAARYDALPARWSFVTAPDEASMQTVARGFLAGVTRGQALPNGEFDPVQLAHSNRFALIDGRGQMRGAYEADDEGLSQLVRDVGRLAAERD